jgi:chromate transporter
LSPDRPNRPDCPDRPTRRRIFLSFLRLGVTAFGGPAMTAQIRQMAVSDKRWIEEDDFRRGLALCQAVPGATAMQCAAYVGLRLRSLVGAAAAYVGFVLPAFLLMLAFSVFYRRTAGIAAVAAGMTGLRALVVGLVAHAAWTFGRTSIRGVREAVLAALAGAAFFFGVSPFLIVVGAGLAGTLLLREPIPPGPGSQARPKMKIGWSELRGSAVILAVAAALMIALLSFHPRLAQLGLVMMKVDLFAFGGGFSALPLLFREVVGAHGWMSSTAFMDGIALGQATPGPIVITATFVGFQTAGLAGALVATAYIFILSLFMVVLFEPWFRRFSRSPVFQAASRGIILSFVGLLASVTIHFARVTSWSLPLILIAAAAFAALLKKVPMIWIVLAGAAVSILL